MSDKNRTPPDTPEQGPPLSEMERKEVGAALRDAVLPSTIPNLVDGVMQELEAEGASASVGSLLRRAQEDIVVPDIASAVLHDLGLVDSLEGVGTLMRDPEGASRADEIGRDVVESVAPEAETLEVSVALTETLASELRETIDGDVIAALSLQDSSFEVGTLLRELVADGQAPDLVDDVMGALGLEEGLSLGELLGPDLQPDLWSSIETQIAGADEVSQVSDVDAEESPPALVSLSEERESRRRWVAPGAVWAAAAAALIFVFFGSSGTSTDGESAEMGTPPIELASADSVGEENATAEGSESNENEFAASDSMSSSEPELGQNGVVIEELGSESNAFVQVLQFEEDAPPIIFITELDDSDSDESSG
jgi:hypothetical protein